MTDKERRELEVSQKKEIDQSMGEPTRAGATYVPEVDIAESDEAITVYADLPGVSSENIDIDLRDGVLTLAAELKPLPANRRLIYGEYDIGGYQRRFNLGERIDSSNIKAKLDAGVLTLVLPKAEEHKPRKIQIAG